MANKGQQRGNREVRKPKQTKAANPFAATNKAAPSGNAGTKGKG